MKEIAFAKINNINLILFMIFQKKRKKMYNHSSTYNHNLKTVWFLVIFGGYRLGKVLQSLGLVCLSSEAAKYDSILRLLLYQFLDVLSAKVIVSSLISQSTFKM